MRTYLEKPGGTFPSGLIQPPGSCRFGLDALLLASFAARVFDGWLKKRGGAGADSLVIELGCGCGAGLLAFALLARRSRCVGIEREDTLIGACRQNAGLTGIGEQAAFFCLDLSEVRKAPFLKDARNQGRLVFANPPWRQPFSGKPCGTPLRERAKCASGNTLEVFCGAASALLAHGGFFCCVLPPGLLPQFCHISAQNALGLRRILPVASFRGKAARIMLLLCQKNARAEPEIEAPLVLHYHDGEGHGAWTRAARAFCPWLKSSFPQSGG